MRFVVTTFRTPDWADFAEVTETNKKEYCERHGYGFIAKVDEPYNTRFHYGNPETKDMGWEWGFERGYMFKEAFSKFPECEWVMCSDTDGLFTNHTLPLDRLVDNRFHVIIPADINGINCGNILVRNSEIGRGFVNSMIGAMPAYRDNPMSENQWIQEMSTATYWRKWIKIVPQRMFNSYDFTLYQFPRITGTKDILGVDGQWQSGDFLIHIVGGMAFDKKSLQERIEIAKMYLERVIK